MNNKYVVPDVVVPVGVSRSLVVCLLTSKLYYLRIKITENFYVVPPPPKGARAHTYKIQLSM